MKRRFFSLLLVVLTSTIAFAGPVDLEQAKGKAARFMKELNGSRIAADAGAEYAPARSVRGKRTKTDVPAYYVFNVQDEKGFVIVSGDDNTDDILGYSTNGSFDMESMRKMLRHGSRDMPSRLPCWRLMPHSIVHPCRTVRNGAQSLL